MDRTDRRESPFDAFAWFYDRYWSEPFGEWQMPALEHLLFPHLRPGDRVLDLCCGNGTLARKLAGRGYKVTGIDDSAAMLGIARAKVPDADFVHADAADFHLNESVKAVTSFFDSLNHILDDNRLRSLFESVARALEPGGFFLFDINTPDAYGERWNDTFSKVEPDHAFFLRGGYDAEQHVGRTLVTMFRLGEHWERSDVEIRQRPLEIREIESVLRDAGFAQVESWRAIEDLRMQGHYGIGRTFVRARQRYEH